MTDEQIIKALEEEKRTAIRINHRFMEACDTENPDDDRFITLLIDTLDLINRQRAEIEKWKSVATEPPTENGSYIICTELGKVCTAHFYTGTGRFSGYAGRHAVYWQELPKPPAEMGR